MLSFFDGSIIVLNGVQSKVYNTSSNPRKLYFEYPCSVATDCYHYEILFRRGIYLLEVWGAQGCNVTNNKHGPLIEGGTGGHSAGVFIARTDRLLYLHLGGSSSTTQNFLATYNGGGAGVNDGDGCGGGASDFRTKKGAWNENFESRILISGGGGGSYGNDEIFYGGKGGGLNGGTDSTKRSAIGTQTGCEGPANSQCGRLGIGQGGWYAASGGGKFGGGNYKIVTPQTGSGGGGGSGSIDGVVNYSVWTAITEFSDHHGLGTASITIIKSGELLCSNIISYSPWFMTHLLYIHLFSP